MIFRRMEEKKLKSIHITPKLIDSDAHFEEIGEIILILCEPRLLMPHVMVHFMCKLD